MGTQKNQLLQIRQVFEMAQKGHQNLAKLVTSLKQMYNQLQDDTKSSFHEEFINLLKYPMTIYKREPAVERVIEFIAKFTTSFEQPVDDEESDEDENSFMLFLFHFLLKSHSACSHSVRFRACQLMNRLLGSMSENAQIDDELHDHIYEAMMVRLKDKFPNVRIQAVLALARLQDPTDEKCPVIDAYLDLIECDTNPEVRRSVLSCIAPSAKTLPKIIRRTMDIKDYVRKKAYEVLSEKIHIKAFSIAQRVKLLKQGLNDRSDAVKEVVKKKLLQAWLRAMDGNVLDLLHCLDVENCIDVAESALDALFAQSPLEDLVANCQNLNGKIIPAEDLTCESVLYWRNLCNYMKTMGDKGEEALEKLLPEAAIYASYLLSYLKNFPVLKESLRADFAQVEDVMKKEFISQELLSLVGCLDISEEGGRKCMLSVLKEILLLPNTPSSLVANLMKQLLSIQKDDDRRIWLVAEIISDVRVPTIQVHVSENADEERKRQVKLSSIKVKLIEAKQALEESIASQDFISASELKEKIEELENIKNEMLKEIEQPQVKEVYVEKDDPETMLRCLIMCNELLKQMAVTKGLGSTLNGITEALILPSIANVNPAVRNMAVLCLGSSALHSKDLAIQHLPLLLQITQLDEARVKISALQAVFDILQVFGIEVFKPSHDKSQDVQNEESGTENEKPTAEEITTPGVETDTVNSILTLLLGYLDSEIPELKTVAAEGFAKLLFSGRLSSPKLLTRLILLWYNPVTEDDTFLRHCLGVFFPLYAFTNRKNQECFQEAFLPTLKTLFYAPASSPLAEINALNVAEFFVDLTRVSTINSQKKQNEDYQELAIHDNLAIKICNEILKDPNSPDVRILVKTLGLLELTTGPSPYTEQLCVLLNDIKEIKNKVNQRVIEKIMIHLNGGSREGEKNKDDNTIERTKEIDKDENKSEVTERTEVAEPQNAETVNGKGRKEVKKTNKKEKDKGLSAAKSVTRSKSAKRMVDSSDESERQNFAAPTPSMSTRSSRRTKTAALKKQK